MLHENGGLWWKGLLISASCMCFPGDTSLKNALDLFAPSPASFGLPGAARLFERGRCLQLDDGQTEQADRQTQVIKIRLKPKQLRSGIWLARSVARQTLGSSAWMTAKHVSKSSKTTLGEASVSFPLETGDGRHDVSRSRLGRAAVGLITRVAKRAQATSRFFGQRIRR